MKPVSPWAVAANLALSGQSLPEIFTHQVNDFTFKGYLTTDSCWIYVTFGTGAVAFRPAYDPGNNLQLKSAAQTEKGFDLSLTSVTGDYKIQIEISDEDLPILRYTSTLTPAAELLVPFWPRDIFIPEKSGRVQHTEGEIIAKQVGGRSGQLYFHLTKPKAGAVLYLQNLTALADYNEQTETSASGTVGGEWPEMGFALPPTEKNKPLKAGKPVVISDALIAFSTEVPADETAMIRQYLELTARLYLAMPKPDTIYKPWPQTLDKGLKDLLDSPGCWIQVDGNHYFNAYVSEYVTPPEIMVQLAILLPLQDYIEWNDSDLEVIQRIRKGLPAFYNEKLGTVMRWHPKVADKLEGEEEQKEPLTMDSWYLHHPLLNLSRLALKGDDVAKKLFLDSLEFSIKVAHHFNYEWPVFYKVDTLEVLKEETQPGKGGEKDVPGLYAHVMMQAWELTGDKQYLNEAEKAAQKLQGLGFELFYQANNTAFSAGAMLRLYKATKKEIYKELSYLCLANVFKNVRLWDCNYGYGKNFPSFFTLFPLSDAPYTAAYEEQEVFCAFHDYLRHADDEDIFPPVRLLVAEYIRYLVDRAVYYYPPMLPKEMLQEEPKIGEVDANLWIALEDLHDGWEKSGQVGQEVYGAGNAFGILPRHYMQIKEEGFLIFTDYPTTGFSAFKKKPVNVKLAGDGRMNCRLMIVKTSDNELPEFTVTVGGSKTPLEGKPNKDGHIEFNVQGDQTIKIDWKR